MLLNKDTTYKSKSTLMLPHQSLIKNKKMNSKKLYIIYDCTYNKQNDQRIFINLKQKFKSSFVQVQTIYQLAQLNRIFDISFKKDQPLQSLFILIIIQSNQTKQRVLKYLDVSYDQAQLRLSNHQNSSIYFFTLSQGFDISKETGIPNCKKAQEFLTQASQILNYGEETDNKKRLLQQREQYEYSPQEYCQRSLIKTSDFLASDSKKLKEQLEGCFVFMIKSNHKHKQHIGKKINIIKQSNDKIDFFEDQNQLFEKIHDEYLSNPYLYKGIFIFDDSHYERKQKQILNAMVRYINPKYPYYFARSSCSNLTFTINEKEKLIIFNDLKKKYFDEIKTGINKKRSQRLYANVTNSNNNNNNIQTFEKRNNNKQTFNNIQGVQIIEEQFQPIQQSRPSLSQKRKNI